MLSADFITNAEVYIRSGLQSIQSMVRRRRLSLFGHIARMPDYVLAKAVQRVACDVRDGVPPFPNWRRPSGRPRITWLHHICSDCGLSAGDALNCAHDRAVWKTYATTSSAMRWWRRYLIHFICLYILLWFIINFLCPVKHSVLYLTYDIWCDMIYYYHLLFLTFVLLHFVLYTWCFITYWFCSFCSTSTLHGHVYLLIYFLNHLAEDYYAGYGCRKTSNFLLEYSSEYLNEYSSIR